MKHWRSDEDKTVLVRLVTILGEEGGGGSLFNPSVVRVVVGCEWSGSLSVVNGVDLCPIFDVDCILLSFAVFMLSLAGLPWSGLFWSGLVWSALVWSGLVWSGLVWSAPVWLGLPWCALACLCLPWSGLVWSSPIWSGPV